MWTCPKCKRKFEKKGQSHSCTVYPIEKHFKGKEGVARPLYDELKAKIRKDIGAFREESLPCCIHFVSTFTFAGVYALRDKIRIHFGLDYELKDKRIDKYSRMSANRFFYSIDVKDKKEIDKELIGWLKQAYNIKKK
jgi:hypothetical protein